MLGWAEGLTVECKPPTTTIFPVTSRVGDLSSRLHIKNGSILSTSTPAVKVRVLVAVQCKPCDGRSLYSSFCSRGKCMHGSQKAGNRIDCILACLGRDTVHGKTSNNYYASCNM